MPEVLERKEKFRNDENDNFLSVDIWLSIALVMVIVFCVALFGLVYLKFGWANTILVMAIGAIGVGIVKAVDRYYERKVSQAENTLDQFLEETED